MIDLNGRICDVYYDLNNIPIERTPEKYPYSYDEFVVYKSKEFNITDTMVYSDRMIQWDREGFRNAMSKVFPSNPDSQMFHGKNHVDIEQFLKLYFKKNIKLTAVLQGCNASNGYPYWVFAYVDSDT